MEVVIFQQPPLQWRYGIQVTVAEQKPKSEVQTLQKIHTSFITEYTLKMYLHFNGEEAKGYPNLWLGEQTSCIQSFIC